MSRRSVTAAPLTAAMPPGLCRFRAKNSPRRKAQGVFLFKGRPLCD